MKDNCCQGRRLFIYRSRWHWPIKSCLIGSFPHFELCDTRVSQKSESYRVHLMKHLSSAVTFRYNLSLIVSQDDRVNTSPSFTVLYVPLDCSHHWTYLSSLRLPDEVNPLPFVGDPTQPFITLGASMLNILVVITTRHMHQRKLRITCNTVEERTGKAEVVERKGTCIG